MTGAKTAYSVILLLFKVVIQIPLLINIKENYFGITLILNL